MSGNLVKEIAAKAALLPLEQQQKALAYIESLVAEGKAKIEESPAFQSIFSIIPRRIENLEADLAEVRREMWQNFPREEPK